MSSSTWTSNNIRLILASTLKRLRQNPKSFNIKQERDELRFMSNSTAELVYFTLNKNSDNIFISIDSFTGSFRPEKKGFFWQKDLEYESIMELKKELISFGNNGISATDAIIKAFPEAIDIEFENKVLLGDPNERNK